MTTVKIPQTPNAPDEMKVNAERSETTDPGPSPYTIGGQDADTGKKPEDKQSAIEQWDGDRVSDPTPRRPA